MRLGDVTFDAEGGEKGVEWAGGGGFDHSILIRFKRFIQNPFALSLSKGRSCLEGRKKTVLRQAQHERMRGQFSIWKVSRSEEHTSELQSLMRISYAVFCLKKKKTL